MKLIHLSAETAEQQALQLFGQLASDYQRFRLANPATDLKGFRIQRALSLRAMRATFRLVIPLELGSDKLILTATELPEMSELGPLTFWDEPMTFDNGQTLDF